MIPAIAVTLPVAEGAGSAPSGASNGEAGVAFGNAVKDAGRDHAERQGAKRDEGGDAKSSEAEAGTRAERKRGRVTDGDEDTAGADAPDGAVVSPADILGRLLGVASARPVEKGSQSGEPKGGEPDGDEQLQERLVISTVMDLAGEASGKETPKGQVSLRVLKMETHFEPRIDGATLVDPEKASADIRDVADALTAETSSKDKMGGADKTLRKGFEEILQGLGRPAGETGAQADGDGEPSQDRRGENKAAAAKAADKSASAEATRSVVPSKAVDEIAEPASSTGQIISTQVAGRIVEAFGSDRAGTTASSAAPGAQNGQLLRMTAGGAALKTLSIQLQPQDLGRLDVSMRLVDGRLSVELAASEPSTAQALAGDRHTLRKLLEHAGFALDDAAITIVARDVGQVSQSASSGSASADTQGGTSERGQGRSFDGSGSRGQGSSSGERRGEARPEEVPDRRPARTAGNVFL